MLWTGIRELIERTVFGGLLLSNRMCADDVKLTWQLSELLVLLSDWAIVIEKTLGCFDKDLCQQRNSDYTSPYSKRDLLHGFMICFAPCLIFVCDHLLTGTSQGGYCELRESQARRGTVTHSLSKVYIFYIFTKFIVYSLFYATKLKPRRDQRLAFVSVILGCFHTDEVF